MRRYGLLLETEQLYGTTYVVARVVKQASDGEWPANCGSLMETSACDPECPRHMHNLYLDGLEMRGFVSSSLRDFIGFEPEFYKVHAIDQRKAESMVRTLKRIKKITTKANAFGADDVFLALCEALRLDFIVTEVGNGRNAMYRDGTWRFMSIAEGREAYRALIATEVADAQARAKIMERVS